MTDNGKPSRERLLTLRAALVFLISILAGVGAGALTAQAGRSPAEAILVGAAAFAATAKFVDWLIN